MARKSKGIHNPSDVVGNKFQGRGILGQNTVLQQGECRRHAAITNDLDNEYT
jgi:hypothetical protein